MDSIVQETHDLSFQAKATVYLSFFGLYYSSSGAATLKIRVNSNFQTGHRTEPPNLDNIPGVPGQLAHIWCSYLSKVMVELLL